LRTLPLLVLLAALSARGNSAATQPAVLEIGNRRQVFIDARFLAVSQGVQLAVHPPQKTHERTIARDKPWEGDGPGTNASVLQLGDTYHLWYPTEAGLCYAVSRDGIHFDKPNLGLAEYEGSRDNNIVLGRGAGGVTEWSSEGMIFRDPTAPPDERLRYATRLSDELKDTYVFSSPDGIHWRLTHKNVLTFTNAEKRQHLDSQNVIFWDDRINKYVAYMRFNWFQKGFRGRSVVRSESDHLGGFDQVQEAPLVFGPDGLDASLAGLPVVDYYTSGVIKYPHAQNAYYMFPQAYLHYTQAMAEFAKALPINAGPLHTQFAASRDGITWQRFGRRPFVSLGMRGDFDSACARMCYGLVDSVDGREMYLYYLGSDQLHGWDRNDGTEEAPIKRNNDLLAAAGLAPTQNVNIISRLVLRRDGFISARADYAGGEFTTPRLRFAGRELVLNVDTSATGLLWCELRDDKDRPIEGFRLADCDVIHTANDVNRRVTWMGRSDVSSLAGKPVRLRVIFRDTDLYAFQFRD
jgi:hypothetical protein